MFEIYLKKVASTTKRGDAREESYYQALSTLLEEYAKSRKKKSVQITTLPKKTEAGNPDFRVWDGKHSLVGYIEAKSPNSDLNVVAESEQLKRYRSTFPNLILTNFYEFRLYRDGRQVDSVKISKAFNPAKMKSVPPLENDDGIRLLLEKFLLFALPTEFTAESLARELAIRTRFLRDEVIKVEMRELNSDGSKQILGFYEAFKKHLIANLEQDAFADLYAQTITYGLFAARTRANGKFNRKIAYDLIPKTIGILRQIFSFISIDPPQQIEASVDDIVAVLAAADVNSILRDYFQKGKGGDPIFHFYETFLAEYNPKERERRGVYYTPEPVVQYIVRSLNTILKDKFDKPDGLATQSVTVLDPAGGTLTFLAEAARLAVEEYVTKYGKGSQSKFVEEHILKHFFAFELMMAPYAAGHMKMGYLLEELGHKLSGDERFQFYLTNTLEMEELAQTKMPVVSALSEESHLAAKVKKDTPILVILGNPPYSGISANASERVVEIPAGLDYITGYDIRTVKVKARESYHLAPRMSKATRTKKVKQKTWIGNLIDYYKIVDGKWFGERKHWLQDDYVKFIRFAQWKIDQIGEGVVGFITNHAYLDNPTFRGMRQSLLNSFDEIHVLDLHGNSLKKEKAPDGSKDENVFDIQQGVAIVLMVKLRSRDNNCKVYHADEWGLRESKYEFLQHNDKESTKYGKIQPSSPSYFFIPKDDTERKRWGAYLAVPEILPVNVTGIVTARDSFVIDFDKSELQSRIQTFRDLTLEDKYVASLFGLKENYMWRVSSARRQLAGITNWKDYFTTFLYRPFDVRQIYYHSSVVWRTRAEVMKHMLQDNIALIVPKQFKEESGAFVANSLAGHKTVSAFDINYVFPLFVYRAARKDDLFAFQEPDSYISNLSPSLVESLRLAYKTEPSPISIFAYVYAILYSSVYRIKYAEFLKSDFPRVPFTGDYDLFQLLAAKGQQLVDLHLLKSTTSTKPISKCEGNGELAVNKPTYESNKQRVWINKEKYFSGVTNDVWNYHIGGFQVADRWLKDRKGRTLTSEEVSTYTKIVTALSETITIQSTLDPLFEQVEESLIEIKL